MATGVRDKYNVAINGKGYMLRGAPNNPAYRRDEVPTAIQRYAQSDLAYSDFSGSGNFFVAQTDWSGGIKNQKTWEDDAKFYYSTNIDAYSEPGAFKLEKDQTTYNDFAENLTTGGLIEVAGAINEYVGTTENGGSSRPLVYKNTAGSWAEVGSDSWATSQNSIAQVLGHKNLLFATSVGVGNTTVVQSWNGSAWTDHSAAIIGAFSSGTNFKASRCMTELAGVLYVNAEDFTANLTYIMSTADGGATWVEELKLATDSSIADMVAYDGMVYYLLVGGSGTVVELKVFNPVDNSNVSVATFYNTNCPISGTGGRLLFVQGGKLIITVPDREIYTYDGNDLTRVWQYDAAKAAIGINAQFYIQKGGVSCNNRIHWGNLIYDNGAFFNSRKDDNDNNYYVPLYVDSSNLINGYSIDDASILLKDDSNYKATLAENFLVFSEMSQVVSIDKLLNTITVIFDALAANEQIAAEYSTNGGTTWTALDTMTAATEGTNTKREFPIPGSVLYTKLFVRIKMRGTTTTPTTRDVVVGYKPIPNYKNRWQLRIEMSDGVKLLNRQSEQRKGDELQAGLWNEKATKQIVLFEDIDYVECSLTTAMTSGQVSAAVDSTKNFPRRGRIRAVSGGVAEEMIYTSAEARKIMGLSRGQRGTRARAYLSGQVLKNDYSVYIEKLQSEINWTDEKKTEHVATAVLLES